MKRFLLFLSLYLLLLLTGCSKDKTPNPVLAKVDDEELLYNYVFDRVDTVSIKSKEKVNEFINHWINTSILYKEAKERDILDSDEYKELLEEAKKEIAINLLLKKEVYNKKVNINFEEISSYYENHRNEFYLPNDIVSICFAVFKSEDAANEFRNNYNKSNWNYAVENFVRSHAQNLIVSYQDTTFFKQSELYPPDLWKSIIQLNQGDLSKPLKVFDGYMVVKLNRYQKAGEIGSIEFAKNDIIERLIVDKKRQLYNDYLKSLSNKYKTENFYELSNK